MFAQTSTEQYTNLCFILGPACRLVCSAFPIFRIWQVNQENYTGDRSVNLNRGAESVLIVRPELEVELWHLEPVEAVFLESLDSGKELAASVEDGLKHTPDFCLQETLPRLLKAGAILVRED